MVEFISSISETCLSLSHTHTHTYIFVAFLETGNKNGYSFTSVMKRKMWTNVITRWFSQMHQVENNDNTILNVFGIKRPNRTPQEEQKCFKNVLNLEILCITKLKALFSKYLSNPSVSSRVPTIWTYNCSLTQLFLKFSENLKKNISGGAHTVLPLISTPSPPPTSTTFIKFWNWAVLIRGRRLFQS